MLYSGMWRRVDLVWLQPPAHAGSSIADFSILRMEAIRSSETPVHTRTTRRHIPEDGIIQIAKLSVKRAGENQPVYVCVLRSRFDTLTGPRPRAPLAEGQYCHVTQTAEL
jgi:hypothetical protein